MLGALPPRTSPIYPDKAYYVTGFQPGKASDRNKVVAEVIGKAFPKFAMVMEGCCNFLRIQPEQISTYLYAGSYAYGQNAQAYAASISPQPVAQDLSGLGAGGQITAGAQQAAIQSAEASFTRQAAQQAAVQSGAVASGMTVAETAAAAAPYVGVAAILLELATNYKAVLTSARGRLDVGMAVGATAVATGATMVSGSAAAVATGAALITTLSATIVGAVAAAVVAAVMVWRMMRDKKKAKAEKHRWQRYAKMIGAMANLPVKEVELLVPIAVNQGVDIPKKASADFNSRLMRHYRMLVKTVRLDRAMTSKKPAYTKLSQVPFNRDDMLVLFLQIARDLKVLRSLVAAAPKGGVFDQRWETTELAKLMLQKVPAMPVQVAANLAMQAVATIGQPLSNDGREKLASAVAMSLKGKSKAEITAMAVAPVAPASGGGGLVTGLLVAGGLVAAMAGMGKGD